MQGVGFRPFVYRLAHLHGLCGFVLNDAEGVLIEVAGSEDALEKFCANLSKKAPPLCRIDSIISNEIAFKNSDSFKIIESKSAGLAFTMLSPDVSLCDACKEEMQDPKNRRFAYPFTNCTDCGPRYTIIKTLPYDRKNTSMQNFEMCDACKKEYEHPLDRRYHAEPISCPECGPKLYFLDNYGVEQAQKEDALTLTCKLILEGKIVAIKGLGGFHIVCDAKSDEAVSLLRKRKNRKYKPFAVMFRDLQMVCEHADINEAEKNLICSKERPIVVVEKKSTSSLSLHVTPQIERVGVFLPYTPLHELLLKKLKTPIVATSANLSDEPIIIDEKELLEKLGDVVDGVLSHDRAIINGCDDSVVQIAGSQTLYLRNARGQTPKSFVSKSSKKILAVGANQKNSIAFAFDGNMILSPHIGDLDSLESFGYFTRTLESFEHFYNFKPDIIVCDKHPEYLTTKWAKEQSAELVQIQHHYAHALACMAEYGLETQVLAFCFDGTGYGDNGTIWGGEVLLADTKGYERVCSLKPFRLLGGSKAVKEPKRIALALLFELYSLEEIFELDSPVVKAFSHAEIKALHVMWQKTLNSPQTSSFGRIFDAAASFAGLLQELDFEGQSGLWLERYATDVNIDERFSYTLQEGTIDMDETFKEMLTCKDIQTLASKLIATIAHMIVTLCENYAKLPVVLSGGVFQNKILTELLLKEFNKRGTKIYIQKETPINDASIALGQLYFALHNQGKQ